jgi:hypothetical protein
MLGSYIIAMMIISSNAFTAYFVFPIVFEFIEIYNSDTDLNYIGLYIGVKIILINLYYFRLF